MLEEKLLHYYAKKLGIFEQIGEAEKQAKNKTANDNPLENPQWENMIDGALKALEIIAIASLDWKLTGIVKLLQSWLKDKREEKAKKKQQSEYGVGYDYNSGYDSGFTFY